MSQTPMGPGWWPAPDGRLVPDPPRDLPAPRAGQAPGQAGCEFVGDGTASAILGGQFEFVQQLSGITELAKVAADTRPLPDGTVCLAAVPTPMATGWSRSPGLTVETPGFLGKDVPFGDQAFCAAADLTTSSGVFARRGNVPLYVAMTAAGIAQGDVPSIVVGTGGVHRDDVDRELAQKLAAEIE